MAHTLRRQLERFYEKSKRCHWCQARTRLIPVAELQAWPKGKGLPPNMATIDHLNSRMTPERHQRFAPQTITHVLSCRKCNNERSKQELAQKLDLQRLKSGHPFAVGRTKTGSPRDPVV